LHPGAMWSQGYSFGLGQLCENVSANTITVILVLRHFYYGFGSLRTVTSGQIKKEKFKIKKGRQGVGQTLNADVQRTRRLVDDKSCHFPHFRRDVRQISAITT
jgi:hypothetical protein